MIKIDIVNYKSNEIRFLFSKKLEDQKNFKIIFYYEFKENMIRFVVIFIFIH